jgi:hypothetical protein
VIRVTFSSPDEFLQELLARGPNVEPVLRATLRWSPDPQGAPFHDVTVVATYLRRVAADLVAVTELRHYVGAVWTGLDDPGSRRCRAGARALLAVLDSAARDLGLNRADGVYGTQAGPTTHGGGRSAPRDSGTAPDPSGPGPG